MALLTIGLLISLLVCIAFAAPAENSTEELTDRIRNGKKAPKNVYPFMASLQVTSLYRDTKKMPFCGGSIISEKIILTAAHCVIQVPKERKIFVKVGATNNKNNSEGKYYVVSEVILHPNYVDGYTSDKKNFNPNDIAILKLTDTIQFTKGVQTISLPDQNYNVEEIDEGKGTAAGWGAIDVRNEKTSANLLYATMYASDISICSKFYRVNTTENQLCLQEDVNTKQNTCKGDSGGPFVQTVGNKTLVVGIVSYGASHCGIGPTTFTRVDKYLDFITKYLK